MNSALVELLDLIARWVHVIAGIMWVGNSMLFNWLDRTLRPSRQTGVYGDIWLLHSGGFYLVEKNTGERGPAGALRLPHPLHWFKWQAYTTWLSGAALLLVVYYAGGRALLVDNVVAGRAHGIVIAVGTIAGAFLLYETLWRTIGARAPRVATAASLILLAVAIGLLQSQLSARAAFVHVGALLGTIMAGNVVFTIMPSQRELVDALAQGRAPSQHIANTAKTRSIHNNYITFPVIVLMMSAHFPSLFVRPAVSLTAIIAGGALVRHVLNMRFTSARWKPILAGVLVATAAVLAIAVRPASTSESHIGTPVAPRNVTFADARHIIDRRCAACHSATPTDVSLGAMPAGVAFDTPEQIRALAARIRERAVAQRTMPPANKTGITDFERAVLARWIADGAK